MGASPNFATGTPHGERGSDPSLVAFHCHVRKPVSFATSLTQRDNRSHLASYSRHMFRLWGMPMKILVAALAALITFPAVAAAQEVAVAPVGVAPAATSGVLRAGTSVPLRTLTELTTEGKKLKVGQRFNLEVAEAVTVAGTVVIPVGSSAVGEITSVRNKGMWGKSGKIEARILYVRANGMQIRLSGAMDDKGVTGTAGVVAAAVVIPVVGFFVTGTSAKIPAGSNVTGFVEEDVPVSFVGAAQPAPMVVSTP